MQRGLMIPKEAETMFDCTGLQGVKCKALLLIRRTGYCLYTNLHLLCWTAPRSQVALTQRPQLRISALRRPTPVRRRVSVVNFVLEGAYQYKNSWFRNEPMYGGWFGWMAGIACPLSIWLTIRGLLFHWGSRHFMRSCTWLLRECRNFKRCKLPLSEQTMYSRWSVFYAHLPNASIAACVSKCRWRNDLATCICKE